MLLPSPGERHQRILGNLVFRLFQFIKDNNLGTVYHAPLDVVLGDDVVLPDIIYLSRKRFQIITTEEIRGAPDLVIEILSPATAERDRTYKHTLYARSGVREYWIVDPDKQTIEVMKLARSGYEVAGIYSKGETLICPSLEGFRLNLKEVF